MKEKFYNIVIAVLIAFFFYSCANMAQGPTGGLKDETPPRYKKSTPLPNAVNYQNKKIEIEFDEFLTLDNPSQNLVISPTQDMPPIAKGIGKKISVELKDSLLPNTTYTLDFGNSIIDNDERNAVPDYVFCFSTGPTLDTMSISGTVINAQNNSPVSGVFVGVYSDLSDSVFASRKMERIARTNADGKFHMRNLQAKPYLLFALEDVNSNYYFDLPTEGLAFQDEPVTPQYELKMRTDTVFKDSAKKITDTIRLRNIPRFYPDSLILHLFHQADDRQFYVKSERNIPSSFTLYFKNPSKEMPVIKPLNFSSDDWFIPEPSVTRDTLLYWIKDSTIYQQDTLQFLIQYSKTDSSGVLIPAQDTVFSIYKRQNTKKKKNTKEEDILFTGINSYSTVEYYENPAIEWEKPLQSFRKEDLSLFVRQDTLWNKIDFELEPDFEKNPRFYRIIYSWDKQKEYKIKIDSATIKDIYGDTNNNIEFSFRFRQKEEYSSLIFNLSNAPEKAFLELLDTKDNPIRKTTVINGKGIFEFVKPGEYYLRLIDDKNGNGRWDAGIFKEKTKPENVFYYDKKIKLRVNWEVQEDWNVARIPLLNQKPAEIRNIQNTSTKR